ncbi:hypothetical protein SHJG_p1158 (plasmid) [Streptomyces hygroscopicus subsp. jinggangensis 5008]|nr:hypothetical protein SHJG_p1158 [Streptomyces hygroscopicus subsp. jinggangensis 5008]AGF68443.1 hypothetical protein SHJGH_p1158 [Streptomyces hygroscopicus subsp. jinggangensis TL01]
MRRTEYDETQAAKRLHTTVAVLRWARHAGVVPEPDVRGYAWSRPAVEAMDAEAVRASMPREAISPYEAANRLAAALGTPNEPGQPPAVSAYAVERLIALGLLLDLSAHRRYTLLNPDQVDRVAAREGLAELLEREAPLGPEQAAARLGVRRVDFEWMRRLGWIAPVSWGPSSSARARPAPSTSRASPPVTSTTCPQHTLRSTGRSCARWRRAGAPRSPPCPRHRHRHRHPSEFAGARPALCSSARRVPAVQEGGQGAALRFLAGGLPGEDVLHAQEDPAVE